MAAMEPIAALEFSIDDANAQFIKAGELEVDCGFENVFNFSDPTPASDLKDCDGSSSDLGAEPISPVLESKEVSEEQELAEFVDLELFDECAAKKQKVDGDASRESISVVTEIAPISLGDPWKLQSCWLYLGLHHLYGKEDSEQEKELSAYVVRGKVRRVRIQASLTYLDVFWPALTQEFAVEHGWLQAALPTNFTPPGKTELTSDHAHALLQSAPKKVCLPSPTESPTTITASIGSPKGFARTMSKSEAKYISGARTAKRRNKKRRRQSIVKTTSPSSAIRAIRPSSNYQLVQVPPEPTELIGRQIFVELSQWYCDQQLGEDIETVSRLLVRGKILEVEQRQKAWIADVFWPVFNEVSSVPVEALGEIGARWGTTPGTRELSHEEWFESESQQQPCVVSSSELSEWESAKVAAARAKTALHDEVQSLAPGDFEVSKNDCTSVLGKSLFVPFAAANSTLQQPLEQPAASGVYVKGRIQRVYVHRAVPVYVIAWDVLRETVSVELPWFASACATHHLPEGAQILSSQLLLNPPVAYRSSLARALLSTRGNRRRVSRYTSHNVFARVCIQCEKDFVVYDKSLLSAQSNTFCCQDCCKTQTIPATVHRKLT